MAGLAGDSGFYNRQHMTGKRGMAAYYAVFFLLLALQVSVWWSLRHTQGRWMNVPDAPTQLQLQSMSLGDGQFSFRMNGLRIQNIGSSGADFVPLKDYDFENLSGWFYALDRLAPQSHYLPSLAAFYFSASQDAQKIRPLVAYLAQVGQRPGAERWRWLGQAVYLARFKLEDNELALSLAQKLAHLDEPGMPAWTRQMPAFILNAKGSRAEALAVMLEILKTSVDKIDPNEVNFTVDYICNRLLSDAERATPEYGFCETITN